MMDFKEQLERVSAFFKPENLAQQSIKCDCPVAVLIVDVQKQFCDPNDHRHERGNAETEEISTRIQSIMPEFRKAGIPIYAVYYSPDLKKSDAESDFYKFVPDQSDTVLLKNRDSAFERYDNEQILKKDKRKLLLTCGFNLNSCVRETVLDARRLGFDVCLLEDLTGNDNANNPSYASSHLKAMRERGVRIEKSKTVLEKVRSLRAGSGAMHA